MPRCGGTGSAPSSRRAGRVNGPVRPHAQAARPPTLRHTRVRPCRNGGLFASVVMGGKLSSGRRWSARPRHGDDVVGDRHEGAEDQRDGQPGQDEREDDAAVAGGRPVRRWSPRPLLRPWCRCALAAAVAAHARGSMIAARRYGWMSFRLECPDRRLWTASLRLWIGRVSHRDQDHGPGTAVGQPLEQRWPSMWTCGSRCPRVRGLPGAGRDVNLGRSAGSAAAVESYVGADGRSAMVSGLP